VRLLYSLSNQLAVNVLHANVTGAVVVNQALANTLGSAIKSAFSSNLGTHMAAGSVLARVGVRDLRSANLPEFLDTGSLTAGTGVGDALPTQDAACITLRTALSGKSFRGRVYISGFTEADNDANGFTTAAANTACVAFLVAVQAAMNTSGMILSVASRPAEEKILTETTNHANGTTTVRTLSHQTPKSGTSQAVTSIAARDGFWQSQRRRGNARGVPPTFFDVASHTF
jgi:hypothetical protein